MSFWKPGESAPKSHAPFDKAAVAEGGDAVAYNPNESQALEIQRQLLPIFQHRKHILYLVETCRVVIVVGEPGCGKSTQVPQYLYEAGWADGDRVVCCTQPRRVACITLAQRVAQERGVPVGGLVGYAIRFETRANAATRMKYVTDGTLLQEILADPLLSQYSVVMVDEAHERALHTDVLLGLLRKILRRRPALRVIVASATMQAAHFRSFFAADLDYSQVGMLSVEGRCFPVDVQYAVAAVPDYLQAAYDLILQINERKPKGDILCFMPGQEDVDFLVRKLKAANERLAKTRRMAPLPLYSSLGANDQLQAFRPSPHRKVVVSTNIAETAVTIDGVVYIIDPGFVKVRAYSPKLGFERLVCTTVSRAEAEQRAGRAGRVASGECYRLYTEEWYSTRMPEYATPAMLRSNLAALVLQMKLLGVEDLLRFPFPSAPPTASFCKSLELLYCLQALDDSCRLTEVGAAMAALGVEPMLARFLLTAAALGLEDEGCKAAGLLSVRDLWHPGAAQQEKVTFARSKLCVAEGDHVSYVNIFNAWEANGKSKEFCDEMGLNLKAMRRANEIQAHLRRQLKRIKADTLGLNVDLIRTLSASEDPEKQHVDRLCACVVSAYFPNAAHRKSDGSYLTVHGGVSVQLHPSCATYADPPEWLLFGDVVERADGLCVCDCLTLRHPMWLVQLAPHFYRYRSPTDRTPTAPQSVDPTAMDRPSNWLVF